MLHDINIYYTIKYYDRYVHYYIYKTLLQLVKIFTQKPESFNEGKFSNKTKHENVTNIQIKLPLDLPKLRTIT